MYLAMRLDHPNISVVDQHNDQTDSTDLYNIIRN